MFKQLQMRGPEKSWFVKGGAERFFHVLLGGQGSVGTIFGGGCTPSACHAGPLATGKGDFTLICILKGQKSGH